MFADCWQLPAPVRSPWHRHKTNRIPLPALIISAFLFDLLFVRNQAILSNCEVPGHWTLPLLLPVGKWKISVASNKYFSVGCLCVYVSIALRLSPLLPGLAPQLRDFLCVIVPSLFLYYPTLRYHDKNRLLLRGRLRFFAIVIVFDWKSKITLTRQRQKLKIWRENIVSLSHYQQGSLVYFPPSSRLLWP